jgi:hypothetical protein
MVSAGQNRATSRPPQREHRWVVRWVAIRANLIGIRENVDGVVQLRLSIALTCAVAGCAQNVVPESLPLPTPWTVEIAQNVPESPSVDKAQTVAPEPSPKPEDKGAILLDCSGLLHGWNNCMLTASNTCGSRGYTILDRSDQRPTLPNESAFARSMHIRCNT